MLVSMAEKPFYVWEKKTITTEKWFVMVQRKWGLIMNVVL